MVFPVYTEVSLLSYYACLFVVAIPTVAVCRAWGSERCDRALTVGVFCSIETIVQAPGKVRVDEILFRFFVSWLKSGEVMREFKAKNTSRCQRVGWHTMRIILNFLKQGLRSGIRFYSNATSPWRVCHWSASAMANLWAIVPICTGRSQNNSNYHRIKSH